MSRTLYTPLWRGEAAAAIRARLPTSCGACTNGRLHEPQRVDLADALWRAWLSRRRGTRVRDPARDERLFRAAPPAEDLTMRGRARVGCLTGAADVGAPSADRPREG